jgi:hypothetical protein
MVQRLASAFCPSADGSMARCPASLQDVAGVGLFDSMTRVSFDSDMQIMYIPTLEGPLSTQSSWTNQKEEGQLQLLLEGARFRRSWCSQYYIGSTIWIGEWIIMTLATCVLESNPTPPISHSRYR